MIYKTVGIETLSGLVDFAKELLGKRKQTLESLKGKRVRVVRAIVFEGDAIEVLAQLQKSLTVGEHCHTVHHPANEKSSLLTITVAQDDMKIID